MDDFLNAFPREIQMTDTQCTEENTKEEIIGKQ